MFRDLVSEQDRKDPQAIPNYHEKHFKEKALMKEERKMMGDKTDDMRYRIEEMEDLNAANRKMVDTSAVKAKRKQATEESNILFLATL